ncbi:hypothetical protein [Nocardiopsis xinjiangensis]|uniref:hypothetical protein n=1 Tax=Nocardiopsis xinjiangensis TaxID=124285 RepID=UPI001F4CC6BF|nr:hypothetical protein [Nocardiopsis xinjiangensis]
MTPEEQEEILIRIGRSFLEAATREWEELTYEWDGLKGFSTDGLYLRSPNGERDLVPFPEVIIDVKRLRSGMYQKGRGTWFSMRYTITPPTHYDVTFNYDDPPKFLFSPSPHGYADDLARFPRDPEHIPAWLQQKIDEANNDT